MKKITKIIIQAGGRGTRLEGLTRNKPKSIVPVNNKPILFYAFEQFSDAEFYIITDYKTDVIEKYLKTFGSEYKYNIIKTDKQGTASGIKTVLNNYFKNNEPVFIMWCDLILSDNFVLPDAKKNFIGISKDFDCRWSFENNIFTKSPSKEHGVAGLFIFKNKTELKNLTEEGAFVEWLQNKNIEFEELPLYGTKEIGTMLAYDDLNCNNNRCRPFNKIEFDNDTVIKTWRNELGRKIAINETDWYKHVKALGYKQIPDIYEYTPLKMKKVSGRNVYEYDCLTKTQKTEFLKKIIETLDCLHNLEAPQPANINDVNTVYYTKTFDRLSKIVDLVPFAKEEFIKINGQYYKNVFNSKDEIKKMINRYFPAKFRLIHGDCTFSNIMFDTFNNKVILIDPRGYFGNTKLYGDTDYDWAKLYYSLKGAYDQFNCKKFTLDIRDKNVEFAIKHNNWEDMEDLFFEYLPNVNRQKIKLLHAIIWLSLTTYAWEDYDSICTAFYNGVVKLNEVL